MKALKLTSIALAAAIALGTANAADTKPATEVLIVTAKRTAPAPIALTMLENVAASVDFERLAIEPPRLDDYVIKLAAPSEGASESTDMPRLDLVLAEEAPTKS
jgi:hypothetical protein